MLTDAQAERFRRLSIGDAAALDLLTATADQPAVLSARIESLVRLAAVIVLDPSLPAYQYGVQRAFDAGAEVREVIAVLGAISSIAGSAVVIAAAPKLAMALGYDVDAAFESG
jgi:hypothetical protein